MSHGNALSQASGVQSIRPIERISTERPKKRVRLSTEATAAIQSRCAHEETALEVDIMILDFVAFEAAKACLNRSYDYTEPDSSTFDRALSMFDSFLGTFKELHPSYKPDAELRFRIQLLKFTTLFVSRLTDGPTSPSLSSLQTLRESNSARAHVWIGEEARIPSLPYNTAPFADQLPLSQLELQQTRTSVLRDLSLMREGELDGGSIYATQASVSLLDVLPFFMQVSAARTALSNCSLNMSWMRLACEFMFQACLEQYLVYGADGSDAIDEAFAWGHKNEKSAMQENGVHESRSYDVVNDMFEDDEDETVELEGWKGERSRWLRKLFPANAQSDETSAEDQERSTVDLRSHLRTLAMKHPFISFHDTLLNFLSRLDDSIPKPVLWQLERGKLDDMSEEQTADFLNTIGIAGELTTIFEPRIGSKSRPRSSARRSEP